MSDRRSALARPGGWLALLAFAALGVLLTWPLALQFTSAFPASPGEGAQDLWQNLWNMWWAGQALGRPTDPFFTDHLFFPTGASLLFHPLNLLGGVLALPFWAAFGPVIAYNTLVLLSFALGGWAVWLLARRHGCGWGASLVGGIVYVASNWHFAHMRLGHLEQLSIQWLPLYVLALDALLADRRRTPRMTVLHVVLAALALLAVIFTSLYMALAAAVLTLLWTAWAVVVMARIGTKRRAVAVVGRVALVGALALLVIGPVLLLPMAREQTATGYMRRSLQDVTRNGLAPLDVLLPPQTHPLVALGARAAPNPNSTAFLGFLPLLLGIGGAVARPRESARWLALGVLAWLLALGPALPFYRLIYALPGLSVARYPSHFILLAVLAVAMLAAFGAEMLIRALHPRYYLSRMNAVTLTLPLLLLLELWPRAIPLTHWQISPFYRQLAAQPGGSVVELPFNRVNGAWVDMANQTQHGHPILYGALARDVPRIPFEWQPLMRELEFPDAPRDIIRQSPLSRANALRFFDVRTLIYHRSNENGPLMPPSAEQLSIASGLTVTQVYTDAELVAFAVALPPGPAELTPIANLGDGWGKREDSNGGSLRWIDQRGGTVQVYNQSERNIMLNMSALAYGGQPRTLQVLLDDVPVTEVTVQPWQTDLVVPLHLPGGLHALTLVPLEPGTTPRSLGAGDDDRPLTVAVTALELADG